MADNGFNKGSKFCVGKYWLLIESRLSMEENLLYKLNNPIFCSLKVRPFIKWAGSKYKLLELILSKLPVRKTLIEPFVGSGAVFLNTNYDYYILNDANADLINLYKILQLYGEEFINYCRKFFTIKNNTEKQYYNFRDQFNDTTNDKVIRAALFLYLNKHGYNGLCRFNQNNKFNVPFGRHTYLNFPEESMKKFYLKSQRAKFFVKDFAELLKQNIAKDTTDTVVYCDPPYVPLSSTANFVGYQASGFDLDNQQMLADLAIKLATKGIPVLISNHFTSVTKKIYYNATEITTFKIRRMISCNPKSRNYVTEILALYNHDI